MATDEQLINLNQQVYGVDPAYKQPEGYSNIYNGQTLYNIGGSGQDFKVIATQNNLKPVSHYQAMTGSTYQTTEGSGFQGMAVAPIVNGKPDLSQTIVVAAGTDPTGGLDSVDVQNAIGEVATGTSGQYGDAKSFVDKVNQMSGVTVVQYSGYSQSGSYMLRLGLENSIPTTVFNGFYSYSDLSQKELDEIKNNPLKYKNYRFKADSTAPIADYLHDPSKYPGVIWLPGGKHSPLSTFDSWFFPDGNLIKNGKLKNGTVVSSVHQALKQMSERNIPNLQSQIRSASGSQKIALRDELLVSVAQDAVLSADDYVAKVKSILSESKEKVQKSVSDGREAAYNLAQYLSPYEVEALLADFQMNDFWDEGVETSTINEAKKFQKSLEQFSDTLMDISQRIQETDQEGAAGFNNRLKDVQINWEK
ncbi:MAG: hypothetical protein LBI13_01555 [Streptococcaceae bacterium]|jgi:hypothetical protein|nr:hypothetical protein [Streptococcaceae bacterium]